MQKVQCGRLIALLTPRADPRYRIMKVELKAAGRIHEETIE